MLGARFQILLIEDDHGAGRFCHDILDGEEYTVEWVTHPNAALTALTQGRHFDLVISDLWLPGGTGIEVLQRARSLNPDAARLLITGEADLQSALGAINEARAAAFLIKPFSPSRLLSAVREALSERAAPGHITPSPDLNMLSPREKEMVELLQRGLPPRQIAESCHISEHTVRNHIKSIYRKLGVHSQLELISKLAA